MSSPVTHASYPAPWWKGKGHSKFAPQTLPCVAWKWESLWLMANGSRCCEHCVSLFSLPKKPFSSLSDEFCLTCRWPTQIWGTAVHRFIRPVKRIFFVFFIMVDRVTKLRFARKKLFSLLLWILDLFLQWFRNVLYRGKSIEILEQQVYYKEIGYSSTSFPVLLWNECHISWKLNIVMCTEYQWTCRFEWNCYKQIFGNSAWLQ